MTEAIHPYDWAAFQSSHTAMAMALAADWIPKSNLTATANELHLRRFRCNISRNCTTTIVAGIMCERRRLNVVHETIEYNGTRMGAVQIEYTSVVVVRWAGEISSSGSVSTKVKTNIQRHTVATAATHTRNMITSIQLFSLLLWLLRCYFSQAAIYRKNEWTSDKRLCTFIESSKSGRATQMATINLIDIRLMWIFCIIRCCYVSTVGDAGSCHQLNQCEWTIKSSVSFHLFHI